MRADCYCSHNFTCAVCLLNAPCVALGVFSPQVSSEQPGTTGMTAERARVIISALANGVDPLTGALFPSDHVLHSRDVICALFTALRALDEKQP